MQCFVLFFSLTKLLSLQKAKEMKREFNTTGSCNPVMHYMVETSKKLAQVETLIRNGKYFTISRARQYGKTTMMDSLFERLSDRFVIIQMSFEGVGDSYFSNEQTFCNRRRY